MNSKRYYRKYIEKLIASNPATVTITRYYKEDDGYGGQIKHKKILKPQTVTIYDKKSQREIASDEGRTMAYMTSSMEKLLAKYDADIKEGDKFKNEGRKYKIVFVKNYIDICKQAELEVVE